MLKSIIIPVYKNEQSIPELLDKLQDAYTQLNKNLEVVFVVDGSPDQSFQILSERLSNVDFPSQLLLHSRNFGSFAAIRAGLETARGEYFAVMAADLQEPPELIIDFFTRLESGQFDVVVGTRSARDDPFFSRLASSIFWRLYRLLAQPQMPAGGVDVFACNKIFRDQLIQLNESNSSLVGLIFWLGFRRDEVAYERKARKHGKSAWTFSRKVRYMMDSLFAFSDLPIRILTGLGVIGMAFSLLFGATVAVMKLSNLIPVPGYSATAILISFFAGLNSFGLGLIGSYVWRAFENTKGRPQSVVTVHITKAGKQ